MCQPRVPGTRAHCTFACCGQAVHTNLKVLVQHNLKYNDDLVSSSKRSSLCVQSGAPAEPVSAAVCATHSSYSDRGYGIFVVDLGDTQCAKVILGDIRCAKPKITLGDIRCAKVMAGDGGRQLLGTAEGMAGDGGRPWDGGRQWLGTAEKAMVGNGGRQWRKAMAGDSGKQWLGTAEDNR